MGCTSNKHQKQNSTNHDNCMYAQWVKNRLLAFKKNIDFHPDALAFPILILKNKIIIDNSFDCKQYNIFLFGHIFEILVCCDI